MGLSHLPTLATRPRPNLQKPQPHVFAKAEKKATKARQAHAFRAAVWARDQGRCRASGRPLVKSGMTDWRRLGEVHHVVPRSLAPERVCDVSNGLLLSKSAHALAETCCPQAPDKRLLDIDGPDDRGLPQTFLWRDVTGRILRRRIG